MYNGMKKKPGSSMKKNAGNKPPNGKITAPVRSQKPKLRKKSMDKEVRTLMSKSSGKNSMVDQMAGTGGTYPYSGNGVA